MTPEILKQLTVQLERKTPCATVTNLRTGQQILVYEDAQTGDVELDNAQKEAVFRRIQADKSGQEGDFFVRVYAPSPRMIVVGAVHVAQFLVPIAVLTGFEVTVIDPRVGFMRSSGDFSGAKTITAWPDEGIKIVNPDARTAIVTLTHDPKLDDPALSAALQSPAFYIGALGSRKTHAKRLQRLALDGFSDADIARINGPVGLAINAKSPSEIAISIVAQVVEKLRAEAA
jgi:xanthine dehydrogenase accessory factor